ncbi:MAG: hypothetical protein ACK55Z_20360, partial [bacterium]
LVLCFGRGRQAVVFLFLPPHRSVLPLGRAVQPAPLPKMAHAWRFPSASPARVGTWLFWKGV